jgi:hypothetical protein
MLLCVLLCALVSLENLHLHAICGPVQALNHSGQWVAPGTRTGDMQNAVNCVQCLGMFIHVGTYL